MPIYEYEARNRFGELVKGRKTADTQKELVQALSDENLLVVRINEAKTKKDSKGKKEPEGLFERVSDRDVAVFCRQFSTMISAGVSVSEALDQLSMAIDNSKLKRVLGDVLEQVQTGHSLSESFARYPSVFSGLFTQMISAAEESGQLSDTLSELAEYLEKKVKLRNQLRSASMYPIFIGLFFVAVLFGIIFFLIPRFRELFDSLGGTLPATTQAVVSVSDFMIGNFLLLFGLAAVLIAALVMGGRTKKGRTFIDAVKLKVPIFGDIVLKVILARFFQTFAALMKSGVDIVASLDIAGKVARNIGVEETVMKMKFGIVEGSSLSDEMEKSDLFPWLAVCMTSVGEKSGSLYEMLLKISEYYTEEVDAQIDGLSTLIEPVMIITLGLVVGFFVITMYLPIFQLAGAVMTGG